FTNSGNNIDYKTSGPIGPIINIATLPNAISAPVITTAANSFPTMTWTAATNYSSTNNTTLIFIKKGSAITQGVPTSAPSSYAANVAYGSGSAYQNDASAFCVYKGDGTSIPSAITGLMASTTYYFLIYTLVDVANYDGT